MSVRLRVIVRTDSCDMAANVGGAVYSEHKTFDMACPPDLADYLAEKMGSYSQRQIIGWEVLRSDVNEGGES